MERLQATESPAYAIIFILFATYAFFMAAIITNNIRFAACTALASAMGMFWKHLRSVTAGRTILFIKAAPLTDEKKQTLQPQIQDPAEGDNET